MKKFIVYFITMIFIFTITAITLGEYFSALMGAILYVAGIGVAEVTDFFLD